MQSPDTRQAVGGTVPIFVSTKEGLSPLGQITTLWIVLIQKILQTRGGASKV
jgi:hypothetical protein